jgi:hypothetical protein
MSPEAANMEPEWLSKLLRPIHRDGFDLVPPTYRRHKFEGLLITNLLYPMIRALYSPAVSEVNSLDKMSGMMEPTGRVSNSASPWLRSREDKV